MNLIQLESQTFSFTFTNYYKKKQKKTTKFLIFLIFTHSEVPEVDSADLLQKQRCLDSLASLRHAKWFQVRL